MGKNVRTAPKSIATSVLIVSYINGGRQLEVRKVESLLSNRWRTGLRLSEILETRPFDLVSAKKGYINILA
jgi:hypothetical protein